MILKIGTRGSRLALRQSEWVKEKLEGRHPDLRVDLVRIKTTGDKILDAPLSRIGGKGLFVKEIEDALLQGNVDVAVHSMKDVPAQLPDRLTLAIFPKREVPYDALVSKTSTGLDTLISGARIGTSSLRRGAQLLHLRPDLDILALRGNVDTRLGKLASGDVQAIILAAAGLKRMGLESRISHTLSPDEMLPAIGQGALGLEVRRDDDKTIDKLRFLDHHATRIQVTAERALLKRLEGGCQVPIAGLAKIEKDEVVLEGMVAEIDGSIMFRETLKGTEIQAADIGTALAERLLSLGADKVLARIYQSN